ncbi:MAG: cytochrome c [Burkholderiales bacterium]|nr:cytochrome c [Burkholderiales bacterium]
MVRSLIAAICLAFALPAFAQVPATGQAPVAPKGIKLPPQTKPPSNRWLEDADSDADRFRKLEIYLRGFDQPMLEVGQRYLALYDAIKDRNWGLADYQWDKVKLTINGGLMKRPARTRNAESIFLDVAWPAMDKAIKSKDEARIREQFGAVRETCMECHEKEKVPFMNESPLFRTTAGFPR